MQVVSHDTAKLRELPEKLVYLRPALAVPRGFLPSSGALVCATNVAVLCPTVCGTVLSGALLLL